MIKHLEIDQTGGNNFIYLILNDLAFNMSIEECSNFKYFESDDSIMYHALCFNISKSDAKAIFEEMDELKAFYAWQ